MTSLRTVLFASACALTLAAAGTAQIRTIPTTTVTRGSSYDGSIGNSWLGGSLHAHATLQTSTSMLSQRAMIDADLRLSANFLQQTGTVGEVACYLNSAYNAFTGQSRNGTFRMVVLGYNYVNQAFTADYATGPRSWSFNIFPSDPSASVPVGPFTIGVSGNAGGSLAAQANFFLPAGTQSVTIAGTGNVYAEAHARVSVGIPGFHVGVGLQGRIANTTLAAWATASVANGISGMVQLSTVALSLQLYAFVDTFIHTWTTTLTSWSTAASIRQLLL